MNVEKINDFINHKLFSTLLIALLFLLLDGCKSNQAIEQSIQNSQGGGTIVGNPGPVQTLAFSAYDNNADNFNMNLCLYRIYFVEGQNSEDQYEQTGLLHLDSNGTIIHNNLTLKSGTYQKIELLIKPNCQELYSLALSNLFGDFYTHEDATLKFNGPFKVSPQSTILLDLSTLIDELKQANNNEAIIGKVKSFQGNIIVQDE